MWFAAQAGDIPQEQVRSIDLPGVVDSGAVQLFLPESICRQLGLRHAGEAGVRYADGRTAARETVSGVQHG